VGPLVLGIKKLLVWVIHASAGEQVRVKEKVYFFLLF